MKIIIVISMLLVSLDQSYSKQIDSLSNYYPLNKENRWLYLQDTYYLSYGTQIYSILEKSHMRDTIINNEHYFMDHSKWLRYDANQNKILALVGNEDKVFMDFNLNVGEEFIQVSSPFAPGDIIATVISKKYILLNDTLDLKGFRVNNTYMGIDEILYGDNIGEAYLYGSDGIMGHRSENTYLIEAVIQINDSTIIYDDKNPPKIIFTLADSIINNNLILRFQVEHEYSVIHLGENPTQRQRHFIDSVLVIYHYEKDSIIQSEKQLLCTLENKDTDFYIGNVKLDQQMINEGYELNYKLLAKDKGLFPEYDVEPDSGFFKLKLATAIKEESIAFAFYLFQNYPNPFNQSTKISWQSPVGSWQVLKVFDVLGNEIATLVNEYKPTGNYEVEFNALETRHGMSLPSGVCFYQLKAGDYIQTKKMILLR